MLQLHEHDFNLTEVDDAEKSYPLSDDAVTSDVIKKVDS